MTEDEVYAKAIKKLIEHQKTGDTGSDIEASSYLFGVMDAMRIIKEGQENEAE